MVIPDPDELPKIGDWYLETDTEDEFQVIDVDPDEGLVEVQYYDGNIDEFSLSDWYAMAPQPIEAPEDWAGPMDSLTDDDVDYDEEPSEHAPPRHSTHGAMVPDNFPIEEETGTYGPIHRWLVNEN